MKKLLLITLLCLVNLSGVLANKITFVNLSLQDFTFSLRGLEDPAQSNTYFESPLIIIPTNTTFIFDNPSDVPGLSGLNSTALFYFVKGHCTSCSPTEDASVGGPIMGFLPQFLISTSFNVSWVQPNPIDGDIVVLITD